jgi:osmoprotectant transport system substrate-binding protein
MLETTDPRLADPSLRLLADDRGLQPPENVVPLVRTAVLEAQGDRLRAALDATSARLTTGDLVVLNRAVQVDHLDPAAAAARWWSTR